MFTRRFGFILIAAALSCSLLQPATARAEAHAQEAASESDWTFSVAPYFFLPSMRGSMFAGGVQQDVNLDFWDLFTKTDSVFALQLHTETWYKKRWGILLDGTWLRMKTSGNPQPRLSVKAEANIGYVEVGPMVHWLDGRFGNGGSAGWWSVDVLLGTRISIMDVATDLTADRPVMGEQTTSISNRPAWADAIAGPRMNFRFGPEEAVEAVLRFDAGVGGGSYSWNAVGLLGYHFDMWGLPSAAFLGGRGFRQFFEKSDQSFTWDVTQFGPMIGLNMYF